MATTNKITIENRYDVPISAYETPLMPTTTCIAVIAIVTNAKSVMLATKMLNSQEATDGGHVMPLRFSGLSPGHHPGDGFQYPMPS
jgi:hypothetical protein